MEELTRNQVVSQTAKILADFLREPTISRFRRKGQTLYDRCEAWVSHALEEIEDEIDEWTDKHPGEVAKTPPCGPLPNPKAE